MASKNLPSRSIGFPGPLMKRLLLPRTPSLIHAYYPSLDGLRAVAIFLVFTFHFLSRVFSFWAFRWGWVGVDIFFVLSGFLITGILFDSVDRENYFRSFYTRRALRIFPLYYTLFACLFLIGSFPSIHIHWNRYNLSNLIFIGNFFQAGVGLSHHPSSAVLQYESARLGSLAHIEVSHLWSLSVEEQFYLIWPAVVWLVRSRRGLMGICAIAFALGPIIRWQYALAQPQMVSASALYFITWFRVDTLLAGAFVALWHRGSNQHRLMIRPLAYGLLVTSLGALIAAWYAAASHTNEILNDPVVGSVGFTLVAVFGVGLLLLTLDSQTWIAKLLKTPALVWVGRRSYGIYVFHGVVLGCLVPWLSDLHRLHLESVTLIILGPGLSVGLAWLSFRYLESPFLKLKPKLAPRPGASDDPPPYPYEQWIESRGIFPSNTE